MMRGGPRRGARGLTLIEVLLSSAILVLGLAIIMAIATAGMRSRKRARNYIEATTIAASALAEARGEFFRDKVPPSDSTFKTWPDDDGYKYCVKIVPIDEPRSNVSAIPREYFVQVEVTWKEGGGDDKKISVQSVMFRNRKGQ